MGNMPEVDITGNRYGKLVAIKGVSKKGNNNKRWLFRCDCGNNVVKRKQNVMKGMGLSCGCVIKTSGKIKHGFCIGHFSEGTPTHKMYNVWAGIKQRCYNKASSNYVRHGGVGRVVDQEWKDSFINFYNDTVEGYKAACDKYGKSKVCLRLIDRSGDYTVDNCVWDRTETLFTRIKYRYGDNTYTAKELSVMTGKSTALVRQQLYIGHSIKEVVEGIPKKDNPAMLLKKKAYLANKEKFANIEGRHKEILEYTFGDNPQTLKTAGEKFYVTRERIRQIINYSFYKAGVELP